MKEIVSTLTGKGQVTIPAEVRRHLGVGQGDMLSFVIADDGRVEVRAPTNSDIASLAGAAGTLEEPMRWDQMREMAREDRFDAKHDVRPRRSSIPA